MSGSQVIVFALIVLGLLLLGWLWFVDARREARKNRAWLAHMERLSRRCPACQPWGGWYLGRMREDGSYETHTCEVCGGTGELPDA